MNGFSQELIPLLKNTTFQISVKSTGLSILALAQDRKLGKVAMKYHFHTGSDEKCTYVCCYGNEYEIMKKIFMQLSQKF